MRTERFSSPAGPSSVKRKKTASGSGGSTSSKDGSIPNMPPLVGCPVQGPDGPPDSNGGGGSNRQHNMEKNIQAAADKLGPLSLEHIEQMKEGLMPIPPGLLPAGPPGPNGPPSEKGSPGAGIANYVPNQRLEWKRYKQYTRNDIMAAIEEVKAGE